MKEKKKRFDCIVEEKNGQLTILDNDTVEDMSSASFVWDKKLKYFLKGSLPKRDTIAKKLNLNQ